MKPVTRTFVRLLALLLIVSGSLPAFATIPPTPNQDDPAQISTRSTNPVDSRIEPQIKRGIVGAQSEDSKLPAVEPRCLPLEPAGTETRMLSVKLALLEKFLPFFDSLSCP